MMLFHINIFYTRMCITLVQKIVLENNKNTLVTLLSMIIYIAFDKKTDPKIIVQIYLVNFSIACGFLMT